MTPLSSEAFKFQSSPFFFITILIFSLALPETEITMHFNCLPFHKLSLNQLYAILKLRQEVFIVEQNCPYLDADDNDQDSLHLMGFIEHQLVAYTRLVPKGITYKEHASIGRVITSEKIRGEGFGRLLMTTSIENLHEHWGKQNIKISAQSHLVPFYNTLNFESTGEEYLEDGIPHTAMCYKLATTKN